ncbi:MAG: thiamine phosphate synthase [Terriglobia bacterium]
MPARFEICYITDRNGLPDKPLSAFVSKAVEAGIDLIQIREKNLGVRALLLLAERAVAAAQGGTSRVVINDRLDVALASAASGIHLGRHSLPAEMVRRITPPAFRIGVSCHSYAECLTAEEAGADYVLLGPIFETPSKIAYGPPLGPEVLHQTASHLNIPVLAVGGITLERAHRCREAGAAGIAGIRIFQEAPSIQRCVQELRLL